MVVPPCQGLVIPGAYPGLRSWRRLPRALLPGPVGAKTRFSNTVFCRVTARASTELLSAGGATEGSRWWSNAEPPDTCPQNNPPPRRGGRKQRMRQSAAGLFSRPSGADEGWEGTLSGGSALLHHRLPSPVPPGRSWVPTRAKFRTGSGACTELQGRAGPEVPKGQRILAGGASHRKDAATVSGPRQGPRQAGRFPRPCRGSILYWWPVPVACATG
jgi:hypothetical protein